MRNDNDFDITDASLSDYRKLLIFEDKVFRVPFITIMPKIYRNKSVCCSRHRIIKENGKIIAAYADYPSRLLTSSGELSLNGIGSVAVSKSHRNKGLMGIMMNDADQRNRKENVDIGFLSGYRRRYERFGYIPCGEKHICEISENYISHGERAESFLFKPLGKCANVLDDVIALFNSQSAHFQRKKESFSEITSTWHSCGFVIFDRENRFCGYLVADAFHNEITEIVLTDMQKLSDIVVSFAKSFSKKAIRVTLYPWQDEMINEISSFGEHFSTASAALMKFYSFKKPIEVFMNEKLKKQRLCDGTLILQLGNEKLKVTVENRKCTVCESDCAPELVLDYSEAVLALTTGCYKVDNPLFSAWSPMCPISVPGIDMI